MGRSIFAFGMLILEQRHPHYLQVPLRRRRAGLSEEYRSPEQPVRCGPYPRDPVYRRAYNLTSAPCDKQAGGQESIRVLTFAVKDLVVDQRPSGIDPEVMSQIGTRVTCLLDDEADIRAVFSGISGATLRQVLARLDTQQQALILGHAVPMPVVVKTRTYGTEEFYAALGIQETESPDEMLERGRSLLSGSAEDTAGI